MLAPTSNTTTPGSSSDVLIHSRSISSSRAPQEANYQIDDDSRPNALVAPSPQHITDGYAVPSTYTTDSPYRTPSTVRSPHGQPSEGSPCTSHLPAYSPALSSSYIPLPSPTPSQLNAYPVPEGTYGKIALSSHDGAYQHNMYQDPYQRTYQQQPYPEPIVLSYPDPELVDTLTSAAEKPMPSSTGSTTKPTNNGRRKKFIWIGSFVILILIGAIVGVVVSMKNKDSDKGGNSSDNSTFGKGSSTISTTPTLTATSTGSIPSVPVTVSSTPVTVSYAPVTVPTPTSGGSGSVVTPKPLPPLPAKGQCPTFFCDDWFWDCRNNVCAQDGNYKACTNKCNGDVFCEMDCRRSNPCQKECSDTWSSCRAYCR